MILRDTKIGRRRETAAVWLVLMASLLALLTPLELLADTAETVNKHIGAAEEALREHDFWRASTEYQKAAALSDDSNIARQATRIAYSYGFSKDARVSAERWVALDDVSDEARLYLALLELRDGDIKKARNSFRRLLRRGEEPADERLVNLIPFLSKEDPQNADKLMRQLSKQYKKSAHAHYAAAVMALYAGDSDEALKRSAIATELRPDWLKPHLLYARALLLAGDGDAAIDYTARLVGDALNPDPEARLELAIMYLAAGRDDDALSQINQVLLEQPSRTDALRLMAIINFQLENLDAAQQDFQDLLASGQYDMDAFYYLARIADHQEDQKRAFIFYSKVTQGDNAVISQRRAAGILVQQEKFDQAQKHLDNFGRRHPGHAVDMIQAQAQLLTSQERYDEALEYFDRVIVYRPERESSYLGKAELLLRMDRLDDAIGVYRQALERWPRNAIVLNALGYTLADRTEHYREASKMIKSALKLDPDSAAIIDSHGWVLYRLGDYEKALSELERAYAKLDDPEVAAHIIEVLWKMGRQDEALERLVDAEELWPDSSLLERVRALLVPAG